MISHKHGFPLGLCGRLAAVWFAALLAGCGPGNPTATQAVQGPTTEPGKFAAVYQAFEQGFMVYAEGRGCLYAYAEWILLPRDDAEEFSNYRYCLPFEELPEGPEGGPPGPFGRVWAFYADVAAALGAAQGEPVHYQAGSPPAEPVAAGGVWLLRAARAASARGACGCGGRVLQRGDDAA